EEGGEDEDRGGRERRVEDRLPGGDPRAVEEEEGDRPAAAVEEEVLEHPQAHEEEDEREGEAGEADGEVGIAERQGEEEELGDEVADRDLPEVAGEELALVRRKEAEDEDEGGERGQAVERLPGENREEARGRGEEG